MSTRKTGWWMVVLGALLAGVPARGQVLEKGFESLFDGRTLDQWLLHKGQQGHWRAESGVIHYDGKSEGPTRWDKDLYTRRWFRNFEFRFEWRFPDAPHEIVSRKFLPDGGLAKNPDGSLQREKLMSAGDSGIYLRGWVGAQVNLWCHPMGSGQVHGVFMNMNHPPEVRRAAVPTRNMDKPAGEWNKMTIICINDRVTVSVNGVQVVDIPEVLGLPYGGPLALQHHGSRIEFRNLRIKDYWPTGPHSLP